MDPNPTPSERTWTVPCYVTTAEGDLLPDPQGLASALYEVQAILTRVGGVIQMGTKRESIPVPPGYPEQIATTAVVVRWKAFAPVVRDDPAAEIASAETIPLAPPVPVATEAPPPTQEG